MALIEKDWFDKSVGLVPTNFFDFGFFDRQRSLYNRVCRFFDYDFNEFEKELEYMRNEMFPMDNNPDLQVEQPFIEDVNGAKKFKLNFNCKGFDPEGIQVKIVDNQLSVHAKYEEKGKGKSVYREFTKTYTLPKNVNPSQLTSTLSKDGVLAIEAPAPQEVEARRERLVPVEYLSDQE